MDQFAADGYDLLLAGHTHGGQVCVPGDGTLVTNCGIDPERASGLHRHPNGGDRTGPGCNALGAWMPTWCRCPGWPAPQEPPARGRVP